MPINQARSASFAKSRLFRFSLKNVEIVNMVNIDQVLGIGLGERLICFLVGIVDDVLSNSLVANRNDVPESNQ